MFSMDGGIEVLRLLTRRIQAYPVHPFARETGPPRHPVALEQLDRTGDGAATRQQRLTQLVDRLLRGIADEQVPQEPTGHRWERVLACVEAADVVGEDELRVVRHLPNIADLTEMTLMYVISVRVGARRGAFPGHAWVATRACKTCWSRTAGCRLG